MHSFYSKELWVKSHLHSHPAADFINIIPHCALTKLPCSLPVSRSLFICSFFGVPFQYLYINLSPFISTNAASLQPQELTDVLEISNMVFTSLFSLEMLLKLMALGLFGYIKNPYNGFDSVIVIIRWGSGEGILVCKLTPKKEILILDICLVTGKSSP